MEMIGRNQVSRRLQSAVNLQIRIEHPLRNSIEIRCVHSLRGEENLPKVDGREVDRHRVTDDVYETCVREKFEQRRNPAGVRRRLQHQTAGVVKRYRLQEALEDALPEFASLRRKFIQVERFRLKWGT